MTLYLNTSRDIYFFSSIASTTIPENRAHTSLEGSVGRFLLISFFISSSFHIFPEKNKVIVYFFVSFVVFINFI